MPDCSLASVGRAACIDVLTQVGGSESAGLLWPRDCVSVEEGGWLYICAVVIYWIFMDILGGKDSSRGQTLPIL